MATPVFLTIDTEFAWRWHVAGLSPDEIYRRSIEPAGVGLSYQLERLGRHGLRACFFVDPMPALVFGIAPIARMVATILAAGQEVQLHLHPNWTGATIGDRGAAHGPFELVGEPADAQQAMIERARALLVAAGAPTPIAFRAGSYAADDTTIDALAQLGFAYDSSHNGSERRVSRIGLPAHTIAPGRHRGVIEVPVTVIEPVAGTLRTMQLCALSGREMRAALDHAAGHGHGAVTIVSHGFELATRGATHANRLHLRRFDALCRHLARHRDRLPTMHFGDRPALELGRDDRPLASDRWRTMRRQVEQLWSNQIAERGW